MNAVIDHARVYQMGIPDHGQVVRMGTQVKEVKVVKVGKDQRVGARQRMKEANDDALFSYRVEVSLYSVRSTSVTMVHGLCSIKAKGHYVPCPLWYS